MKVDLTLTVGKKYTICFAIHFFVAKMESYDDHSCVFKDKRKEIWHNVMRKSPEIKNAQGPEKLLL